MKGNYWAGGKLLMESDLGSGLGIFINGQNIIIIKKVGTVTIEEDWDITGYLHGLKDQHSRKGMISSCPAKRWGAS